MRSEAKAKEKPRTAKRINSKQSEQLAEEIRTCMRT
jgi:hypothetical protein